MSAGGVVQDIDATLERALKAAPIIAILRGICSDKAIPLVETL